VGAYRARDLFLVPSLLSLLRVPLAVVFYFVVDSPPIAIATLVAAGLTDVLDGWYARRHDQATATGAVVDPITDKLFVLTVVGTLLLRDKLTLLEVILLGTRDIGEIPLVMWFAASHEARRARKEEPKANVPGKLATVAQFGAVVTALWWPAARAPIVYVAAAVGVVAAISYWRRALSAAGDRGQA
jgi:phosphatidylglycerophosphate synthase